MTEMTLGQLKQERDFCEALIKAIQIILEKITDNPVQYPLLVTDVIWFAFGQPAKLTDGTSIMIMGLEQHLEDLERTLELMEIEIDCLLMEVGKDNEM